MTVARARAALPSVLKAQYGRRFNAKTLRRTCKPWTATKVRCRVWWRKRRVGYRGTVTFWNDPADPVNRYISRFRITRTRVARKR